MDSLLTSVRVVVSSYEPLGNCPDVCNIINEFSDAIDCPSFWKAVSNGECDRLLQAKLLRAKWSERSLIHARGAMSRAAQNGNQGVVMLMQEKLPSNDQETFFVLTMAIQAGNAQLSEWLFNVASMSEAVERYGYYEAAIFDAVSSSSVEMLEWVDKHIDWTQHTGKTRMDTLSAVAAERGSLQVLKWLRNHNYGEPTNLALERAAERGHLDVVKWILAHSPESNLWRGRAQADRLIEYFDDVWNEETPTDPRASPY